MKFSFKPKGVCSREILLTIEGEIIKDCEFVGGCMGNAKGLCVLVNGQKVKDVIKKLKGIKCGNRSTSCPDQLAIALSTIDNQN